VTTVLEFIKNNGSFEIRMNGEYVGLISQTPDDPQCMYPGQWAASVHFPDGSLYGTEHNPSFFEIKARVTGFLVKYYNLELPKNPVTPSTVSVGKSGLHDGIYKGNWSSDWVTTGDKRFQVRLGVRTPFCPVLIYVEDGIAFVYELEK
jgi:hypothetical protein